MKKLVFVSFAVLVLGGISESTYGMFNAQDKLQDASNRTSLIRAESPVNERTGEREERNQSENNQIGNLEEQFSRLTTFGQNLIGNLGAQVSRLRTFAQTLLANAERKDKDQLEVYNYQIGNLKTEVSKLATLVETSLANAERKDKDQSEMFTNQSKDLKAEISNLKALVQNLNENVTRLREEKESLIAENNVKSQEIVDQKEEAKSTSELEQQKLAQAEKSEESNADMVAVNKEKTSSDASAAVNVDTVTTVSSRVAIEEMLTELLDVTDENAVKARIQEFYGMVNPPREKRGKGWKSVWMGSYKINIGNDAVKFEQSESRAFPLGVDRIKNFLKDVQTQINDARSGTSSEISARIDINFVTYVNAKSAVEEIFTELLNVAGEEALQKRHQEFSVLVKANRAKGWTIGWRGKTDISTKNDGQGNLTVKFKDPKSQVHPFGVDRIKTFLKDVQTQINDVRSCTDFASSSRENPVSEIIQKPDASSKIDIDSLNYVNAKNAVEEIFTELLNVAGEEALQQRHQEFSALVISNSAKGWKIGWRGKKDISIEKNKQGNLTVKFKDPRSNVSDFGVDRIKNFLKDVQTQINDVRSYTK